MYDHGRLEGSCRGQYSQWQLLTLAVPKSVNSNLRGGGRPFCRPVKPQQCYTGCMKVEEIAEAVATLPSDELARFRRWFTAFEAGRTDHAEELNSTATKLGRLAGRAFAELKKRAKEP